MAIPLPYLVQLKVFMTPLNAGERCGLAPKLAREMVARGEAFWVDRKGKRVSKPVKGDLPDVYGRPADEPEHVPDEKMAEEALAPVEEDGEPSDDDFDDEK